jgi:hypothetical protein
MRRWNLKGRGAALASNRIGLGLR